MKNTWTEINGRPGIAVENISELEDIAIETQKTSHNPKLQTK